MVVSFNWLNYSVAFSFLKRGVRDAEVKKMWRPVREQGVQKHDFFQVATTLKRELADRIRALAIKMPEKQELLLYISQLLKPHTELRMPQAYPFRIAINNAIERNVEKYCSIRLNRQELSLLWQDIG